MPMAVFHWNFEAQTRNETEADGLGSSNHRANVSLDKSIAKRAVTSQMIHRFGGFGSKAIAANHDYFA